MDGGWIYGQMRGRGGFTGRWQVGLWIGGKVGVGLQIGGWLGRLGGWGWADEWKDGCKFRQKSERQDGCN